MNIVGFTPSKRLNEAAGVVLLAGAASWALSLASFHPGDPSWNMAGGSATPANWMGHPGAHLADASFQLLGAVAYLLPCFLFLVAVQQFRAKSLVHRWAKVTGSLTLLTCLATLGALFVPWKLHGEITLPGGAVGALLSGYLVGVFNPSGAALVTLTVVVLALYLSTSFTLSWFVTPVLWPARKMAAAGAAWSAWRAGRAERRREKRLLEEEDSRPGWRRSISRTETEARWTSNPVPEPEPPAEQEAIPFEPAEIPIRTLEDHSHRTPPPIFLEPKPEPEPAPVASSPASPPEEEPEAVVFQLPSTELLNEPQARNSYDSQELQETAVRIKNKFEEFNVLGNVVQINPGPVVTTFEFKLEAGIKYSRIISLNEDLCLGLQAESILIERVPGKSTVGIEVPNSRREVISLRQILESEEFTSSASRLTLALGKDISGRIRVTSLDSMPHLLIAGSTGSGKSVMLNSMIMSILYKSTPDEVRMIMVDPKRVELGVYEGIPHLLTPVITGPRKATNALRNAVLEMERRLKLLAKYGVRNIEQFNRKARQEQQWPSLFDNEPGQDLQPLPYVLILIDELADLMMVERSNVEVAVTRLAQMARAVGMHLVLATQRPSVDVITGLIKANFPARVSFRVATRVDSRTVLDVMGAEHLLGKGDMLFLPPGSSRMTRVHGPLVTENEIARVVDFWKQQASPNYDQTYLASPAGEEDEGGEDELDDAEDAAYEDAVRLVVEMGKASTSILQRRLRLGYGRAARLLDIMQREGIIGPPDGSRPREVLRAPDWLRHYQTQDH